MNKKTLNYEKPAMKVVRLQQHAQLLTGSGVESTRQDYDYGGDDTW